MKSCLKIINGRRVALLGGLSLLLPIAALSANDVSPTTTIVTGITRPSEERKLTFAAPGLVSDVAVKDGDVVKKGQLLASQDDRQEQFTLKSYVREASSDDKIAYSKSDLASKELVYKRKKAEFEADRAASQSEVDEAELAVKLANAQIALAELEHDQKGWDAEKQKVKIEQMHIASPLDGIVEKINIGAGEMADPQVRDGAIIVGQWDPLWLEVHLPSGQAAQLKLNQQLSVRYDGGDWQPAKIIFFEKVDAASDTEMVRLELPNPNSSKLPGLHMQVKLPETVSAVAATSGQ
jgi:multidrug efflux pump subunit AcrA (membrane-fusion protein)